MPKRHWSREEIEILCKEYPTTPTSLLADLLGKSQMSINAKATYLGLKKTPELISQIRRHATDSRRTAR